MLVTWVNVLAELAGLACTNSEAFSSFRVIGGEKPSQRRRGELSVAFSGVNISVGKVHLSEGTLSMGRGNHLVLGFQFTPLNHTHEVSIILSWV